MNPAILILAGILLLWLAMTGRAAKVINAIRNKAS